MATQKIEFSAKNAKAFSIWLKKFSSIDLGLLLEIDEPNSTFLAKTYNEERSVVKLSKIKFDEAGFLWKPSKTPNRIKVGIYNISRLMKIIDQFNDDEFTLTVNYDEIIGEEIELAGQSLLFKNKDLKMTVDCTTLNIFKYISDDLFTDTIANVEQSVARFNLSKDQIEKINSLCILDNESKFMKVKAASNIYIAGKTFDLLIDEVDSDKSEQFIDIFKDQFNSIDIENYSINLGDEKLVFLSDDLSTTVVVSGVETD